MRQTGSGASEGQVSPLEGPRATMVDAIVSALAVVRSILPRSSALPASIDLVAAEFAETAEIAAAARVLVERLLEDVAGEDQQSLSALDAEAALGDLRAAVGDLPTHVSRAHRKTALADAASIIREIGLERYDCECLLSTDPGGTNVIVSAPVSPATAHVWLLDRLCQRAESFALADRVLAHERMASAWYFSKWSVLPKGKLGDAIEFTRQVREQEWSLVERETVTLGEPIMAAFARDERFAEVPVRQQRLARALLASVVDVFVVEAVDDHRMMLRSVRGGRALRVHEHNEDVLVEPGYFLIGRLIPFEGDLWLRSPGTVSFAPRRPDEAAVLADALQKALGILPLPIGIEALISTVVFGGRPPLAPRPASSASAARAMVQFMTDALEDLGRREEISPSELPGELATRTPLLEAGTQFYRYTADEPLAEWLDALSAQADTGPASGSTPGAGGATRLKRHEKKKGKRRNR